MLTQCKALASLLIVAGLLLVAWSLVVPIFEAPDEPAHWQYARYLHDAHRLPVLGPAFVEAHTPPLPYLLLAPVAVESATPQSLTSIDARGQAVVPYPPHYFRNASGDLARYWPIRAARLINALLAVITVWLCYLTGREATGRAATGLLAASLVAFLPEFTFRAMNVSDDTLLMLFAALTTYLLMRIVRRGYTWGLGIAAALAIASACLCKTFAFFFPAVYALAVLTERGTIRARLTRLAPLFLTLALLAPWLLRNQVLYNNPLALGAMRAAFPLQFTPRPLLSPYFVTAFPRALARSFIGKFGWMNVGLPIWIYLVFLLLGATALYGLVRRARRCATERRLLAMLLAFPALNLLLLCYINLSMTQPQGRYLFAALPATMVLAALGLESLPGWSDRRAAAIVGGLALLNAAILGLVVFPAYWPPLA